MWMDGEVKRMEKVWKNMRKKPNDSTKGSQKDLFFQQITSLFHICMRRGWIYIFNTLFEV